MATRPTADEVQRARGLVNSLTGFTLHEGVGPTEDERAPLDKVLDWAEATAWRLRE